MAFSNLSNKQRASANTVLITDLDNRFVQEKDSTTARFAGVNAKLESSAAILSQGGVDYTLDALLSTVVENKSKLTTFTNSLNGAVGDANTGVISLLEQVAQNKADVVTANARVAAAESLQASNHAAQAAAIAAEESARVADLSGFATLTDNKLLVHTGRLDGLDTGLATLTTTVDDKDVAARAYTDAQIEATTTPFAADVLAKMSTIAFTRREQHVVSAEGAVPEFSMDGVPMEADFGLPIDKISQLKAVRYICKSPDGSITQAHSMTVDIKVWSEAGALLSSTPVVFFGRKASPLVSPISLPPGCNVELKYNQSSGVFPEDTRYRILLSVHATDIDVIAA